MATDFIEQLKGERAAPESIESKATEGIEVVAEKKEPPQMQVSDYLATLNRRQRRIFARENGIFVPGSNVPFINTRKEK